MNFKIDTREKFTIITPLMDFFSDNLTAELKELVSSYEQSKINLIINFKNVTTINDQITEQIAAWQNEFYNNKLSFVICEIQQSVKNFLEEHAMDDVLNIAPTETEAWDIVQMEEIERELLNDAE
ncbi:MAG TPA: STAS domain-containing protein [Parafilimonas sp.]|nr:STAS domain-containing protein [Parafilimonas sp.]